MKRSTYFISLILFISFQFGSCENPTNISEVKELNSNMEIPTDPLPDDSPISPPSWLIGEWEESSNLYTIMVNGANIILKTPYSSINYYEDYDSSVLTEKSKNETQYQLEINYYGNIARLIYEYQSKNSIRYHEGIGGYISPYIYFRRK